MRSALVSLWSLPRSRRRAELRWCRAQPPGTAAGLFTRRDSGLRWKTETETEEEQKQEEQEQEQQEQEQEEQEEQQQQPQQPQQQQQ